MADTPALDVAPRPADAAPDLRRRAVSWPRSWLLLGCVVVPLAFSHRLDDAFALPKLVALSAIISLAGLAAAVSKARHTRRRASVDAVDVAVAMFVGLNAVAVALSIDPAHSVLGERLQYQGAVAVGLYAASFVIARSAFPTPRSMVSLLIAISIGGIAVSAYALLQRVGRDPIWDVLPNGRVFSSMGQANALAAYLVIVIPITVVLAARPSRWRALWFVAVAMELGALVLTKSRGGLLGLAVSGIILGVFGLRRVHSTTRTVLTTGVAAALTVAAVVAIQPGRAAVSDMVDRAIPGSDVQASDSLRLHVDLWQVTGHMILDHPAFGTGQETFPEVFDVYRDDVLGEERAARLRPYRPESPHNVYLAIAAGAGVPALSAYLCMIGAFALAIWSRGRLDLPIIGIVAAIAGHLVTDSFMTAELTGSWLLWVLMGAAVGARRGPVPTQAPLGEEMSTIVPISSAPNQPARS